MTLPVLVPDSWLEACVHCGKKIEGDAQVGFGFAWHGACWDALVTQPLRDALLREYEEATP